MPKVKCKYGLKTKMIPKTSQNEFRTCWHTLYAEILETNLFCHKYRVTQQVLDNRPFKSGQKWFKNA